MIHSHFYIKANLMGAKKIIISYPNNALHD